jgi:hypothetical protein
MIWSAYAYDHGPLALYDCPRNYPALTRARNPQTGEIATTVALFPWPYDYPPLASAILWFQGWTWAHLDDQILTVPVPASMQSKTSATVVSSRLLETPTARFVQALPSVLADFPLAWGVATIVAEIAGPTALLAPALAYAATLLAPPIFLDSAFWNQTDALVAVLMVWMVVALLREQLIAAGVILGVGLMTKPQMLLLGPFLIYAALARLYQPRGSWRQVIALWRTGAAAAATILVITAPFMISELSNSGEPLRWLKGSYFDTLANPSFSATTWDALNVWWLHYAAAGFSRAALDSHATAIGLSKDTLGQLAYAASVLVGCWVSARRYSWTRRSLPLVAYFVLLSAFIFPTRVHERYIYYAIPFLIAVAFIGRRRWNAVLAAVVLVGTGAMFALRWL